MVDGLSKTREIKQSQAAKNSPYRNIHPQAVGGASGAMKFLATLEKGNMGVKGSSATCGGRGGGNSGSSSGEVG